MLYGGGSIWKSNKKGKASQLCGLQFAVELAALAKFLARDSTRYLPKQKIKTKVKVRASLL